MIGQGFMDEIDTDVCGDLFDHIDDLLDFPNEAIEGDDTGGAQGCWPGTPDIESLSGSAQYGGSSSGLSLSMEDDFAAGLCVPYEDIAQLEWLSSFVEDSFSAEKIDIGGDCKSNSHSDSYSYGSESQFQTSSPVSVLDTTRPALLGPDTVVPGRARSKRPRPTGLPRTLPITSSAGESQEPPEQEEKKNSNNGKMRKKKKMKLAESVRDDSVRKCRHCGIEKTPQWRMGPMGPKTLCNACGVRYKSGRLFPEYRPAASPTFVPLLHSNSHKKVMEMRTKSEGLGPGCELV